MAKSPQNNPNTFAAIKLQPSSLPQTRYSTMLYSKKGTNNSFKCSHVLSLTGENKAAMGLFPEKSYRKCNKDPNMDTKIKPVISQARNFFSDTTMILPHSLLKIDRKDSSSLIIVWRRTTIYISFFMNMMNIFISFSSFVNSPLAKRFHIGR